jgi:hypothetical protein
MITYTYIYVCIYTCVYIYMYTYVCVYIHVCIKLIYFYVFYLNSITSIELLLELRHGVTDFMRLI